MPQNYREQVMESSYDILIKKLNNFRKKYYTNLIIKGFIIVFSVVSLLILLFSLYEYYSWSDTLTRTIIFYFAITVVLLTSISLIIIPAFKILRLGKTISDSDAAVIIGNYFPEVSDKLLNTLQLNNDKKAENIDLLLASIEQKATELKPISFRKAVSFKSNIKFLKIAIPLLVIIGLILILKPQFIANPTERIIFHSKKYNKPLPYSITLLNDDLTCKQHEDYIINIKVIGDEFPEKIWIQDQDYNYRMSEKTPGNFSYTYKEIISDKKFKIITDEYQSENFNITVFPVPMILDFDINLDYPGYITKPDETIINTGDLIVPENTKLTWNITTRDTDILKFIIDDSVYSLISETANIFDLKKRITTNTTYALIASNEYYESIDTLRFNIETVSDEYPTIKITEYKDDLNSLRIVYTGEISDDYGFSSLIFSYKHDQNNDNWHNISLKSEFNSTSYNFDYQVIADSFNLLPGESIQYFFEVRDNDIFNGHKNTKSETYYLRMPEIAKLEKDIDENSDEIKSKINESLNMINDLDKNIEEKKLDLFNKSELDWLDKQQVQNMIEQAEQIQKNLEELKKLNEEIKELEDLIKKTIDPELKKKLEEMQKMFDELYNEEMKKELEELKENLEKEKVNDFLEQMKEKNEDLKNDLEQNLEIFKQLEYEKMINETIEKLNKLAEKQLELSEKTENKENSKEKSIEEQKDIQKEFSQITKDLEKADELNKELEDPYNMESDTASSNEINQQMDKAQENLQKNKKNKASKNQQESGKQMQKMANSLSIEMQSAMDEKTGEDIEQVKKILDNLLDISFTQEKLIAELSKLENNDPRHVDIRNQQKSLQDDFGIVHDSLVSMSKRQPAIQSFIVKETNNTISHFNKSLNNMEEHKHGIAMREQQYALTSINNLSLMLAESINQMQQSMQMSGKPMSGAKCKNPGKGNTPSMSEIMKQQQGLNKGMKGKMKKDGKDGGEGINSNSKELARMAAQQGEIRKMLQDLVKQLEAEGGNGNALNKIAEEMKKSEDDIINRRLTQQTYDRQKDIETRLLKSDKAMQEREKEKKRESKEGKNRKNGNQIKINEYNTKKSNAEEILITKPIELSPYYKKLYKEYLYKLEKEKNDGEK